MDEFEADDVYRFTGTAGQELFLSIRRDVWGTAEHFPQGAVDNVLPPADDQFEDGYYGIDQALQRLAFRTQAARQFILITDEHRDKTDGGFDGLGLTTSVIGDALAEQGVGLHTIVQLEFDDDGESALGADGLTSSDVVYHVNDIPPPYYVSEASGNLTIETSHGGYNEDTFEDYVDLVFDNGGTAWDLTFIASSENDEVIAFTEALAHEVASETEDAVNSAWNIDSVAAGQQFVRRFSAFDADGDPLEYAVVSVIPSVTGLTIDEETGLVTWSTAVADINDPVAPYQITISVNDSRGGTDQETYSLNVVAQEQNQPPVITSTPRDRATATYRYEYAATATDAESDTLFWSLASGPRGMAIDALSEIISWVPDYDQLGTQTVIVTAADAYGGTDSQTFEISVSGTNLPPQIESTPITSAWVGEEYVYNVIAHDPEGDPLTFELSGSTLGLATLDPETGVLSWTPQSADAGWHLVGIHVYDDHGGYGFAYYTLYVNDPATTNRPPEIESEPDLVAVEGEDYVYEIDANDPDEDVLSYDLLTGPEGASLDGSTLTWETDNAIVGNIYDFKIEVSDGTATAYQWFSVAYRAESNPSVNEISNTTLTGGELLTVQVSITGTHYAPVMFELETAPDGMSINEQGLIIWQTDANDVDAEPHEVTVKMTDGVGATDTEAFAVTVVADDTAPLVTIVPAQNPVALGNNLRVRVQAVDDLAVTALTRTVGGTPVFVDADGYATIPVDSLTTLALAASATDASGNEGTDVLDVLVYDPNDSQVPDVSITTPSDGELTEPTVIGAEDAVTSETDDLTVTYDYNEHGERTSTTDPRGNVTRTDYNDYGQPTSTTDALGNTSRNIFSTQTGLLSYTVDPLGNRTSFLYDKRGNLLTVQDHDGNILVTNTYNQWGDVLTTEPAAGRKTHFAYDLNGNQIASWYYDDEGSPTLQVLTLTEYDQLSRVTRTEHGTLPVGAFITTGFAAADIPAAYLSWETATVFNEAGQVTSTTDRNSFTTENIYDIRGQLIKTRRESVDETGTTTVWLVTLTAYDAAGRVIARTAQHDENTSDPVDGALTTYDDAGRVLSTEQVTGLVINLTGSAPYQEAAVTNAGTTISSTSTLYDTTGRVTSTTDSYNLTTTTTYNQYGDVTETRRQTYDESDTLVELGTRTVYDAYGRVWVTTDQYLDGASVIYGTQTVYDDLGRASKTVRLEDIEVTLDTQHWTLPAPPSGRPKPSTTTMAASSSKSPPTARSPNTSTTTSAARPPSSARRSKLAASPSACAAKRSTTS